MSTKLTKQRDPEPVTSGLEFPESSSLRLAGALARSHGQILKTVAEDVSQAGFEGITVAHVNFIGALDCGLTQSSEVARRLGISRQAVHKTARELVAQGFIELKENPARGNQKIIAFTARGEALVSTMRKVLKRMDGALKTRLGAGGLNELERLLAQGWAGEEIL